MTNAEFSSASDVWSYGVSIWEIYSLGKTPWKGLGPVEIRDMIVEGERLGHPERCPNDMYDVMRACWKQDPQERPTFADIAKRVQQVSGTTLLGGICTLMIKSPKVFACIRMCSLCMLHQELV